MTVAELISALKEYPQNAIVMSEDWEASDTPDECFEYLEAKNELWI